PSEHPASSAICRVVVRDRPRDNISFSAARSISLRRLTLRERSPFTIEPFSFAPASGFPNVPGLRRQPSISTKLLTSDPSPFYISERSLISEKRKMRSEKSTIGFVRTDTGKARTRKHNLRYTWVLA